MAPPVAPPADVSIVVIGSARTVFSAPNNPVTPRSLTESVTGPPFVIMPFTPPTKPDPIVAPTAELTPTTASTVTVVPAVYPEPRAVTASLTVRLL